MGPWTDDQVRKLRKLHLSPERNPPEKLKAIVNHFFDGGTIWAVTDGDGPVHVSKGLATKVRQLTKGGELEWLLKRGEPQPRPLDRGADRESGSCTQESSDGNLVHNDLVVEIGSRTFKRCPTILATDQAGGAWTLQVSLTNRSREIPLGVRRFTLEVSRGDEEHPLHHIGADTYGSHGEVPFAEDALPLTVRLAPAETLSGKLRFSEARAFEDGEVELSLLAEDSTGRTATYRIGKLNVGH